MAYSKARRLADIVVDTNGNINVPTQSASDNDTSAASTAYVTTAVSGLIDSAPSTLNTLNEIAAALNDDANFNTTVTNSIAGKLPLAGGTMTGHLLLNNAIEIRTKDTGANVRTIARVNSSDQLQYGWSGSGPVMFMGGGSYTERMRIHTNGNIGIGETNPDAPLHITSNTPIIAYDESDTSQEFRLGVFGGAFALYDSNDTTFRMLVDGNGNVGINTTTPGALLDLGGVTASSPPKFRFSGTGEASAGDTIGQIDFHSGDTTDNTAGIMASIKAIAGPSGGEGHLQFLTDMPSEGAAAATVALHLHANANVGIGTTSPGQKLDVAGNITSHAFIGRANESAPTADAAMYRAADNTLAFSTANTERMRINSSGKVGIGTNNPTHKLVVSEDSSGLAANFLNANTSGAGVNIAAASGDTNYAFRVEDYAGNERVRINGSGKVGIGTSSPEDFNSRGRNLVVNSNGDTGITISANTSSSSTLLFADSFGGTGGTTAYRGIIEYDHATDHMAISVAATEAMRIDSSGNVGVNTTNFATTGAKFQVKGTSAVPAISGSNFAGSILSVEGTSTVNISMGTTGASTYYGWMQAHDAGNGTNYNLNLNPLGGKVGIGTTSPGAVLHVDSGSTSDIVKFGNNNGSFIFGKTAGLGSLDMASDANFRIRHGSTVSATFHQDGNLIVGGTSNSAAGGKFQIQANKSLIAGIPLGNMTIEDTASMAAGVGGSIVFTGAYLSDGTKTSLASIEGYKEDGTSGNYGGAMYFKTRVHGGNATEKMRINSAKGVYFGGTPFAATTYDHTAVFTGNSVPNGVVVIEDSDVSSGIGNTCLTLYFRDEDPATNAVFIDFRDGGGRVGSVLHNDDGNGVTYGTGSDYRLKENVDYNWDGTTLLKQLKPAKFNFIGKPDTIRQGFLAHEVMDIVPGSVAGSKDQMEPVGTIKDSDGNILKEDVFEHFCKTDEGQTWTQTGTQAEYQQLDYSRLVPLLTKALQEQQTIIDDLKSRIETLEG